MKLKLMAFAAAGIMCLSMAGCSSSDSNQTTQPESNETVSTDDTSATDDTSVTDDTASDENEMSADDYLAEISAAEDSMEEFATAMTQWTTDVNNGTLSDDESREGIEEMRKITAKLAEFENIENPPAEYAEIHETLKVEMTDLANKFDAYFDNLLAMLDGDEEAFNETNTILQELQDSMEALGNSIGEAREIG